MATAAPANTTMATIDVVFIRSPDKRGKEKTASIAAGI
jgi:hypothetical protein